MDQTTSTEPQTMRRNLLQIYPSFAGACCSSCLLAWAAWAFTSDTILSVQQPRYFRLLRTTSTPPPLELWFPRIAHLCAHNDVLTLRLPQAAAYSLPNTVTPLFGGILTDTCGVRIATVTYSGVMFLGALMFWVVLCIDMDHDTRISLMMVSMVVFGLGGESLSVAQKTMLTSWFKDGTEFPKFAFATNLTLMFGYIGVIVNRWSIPRIMDHSLPDAYLVSAAVCGVSFVSLIGASFLHAKYDPSYMKRSARLNKVSSTTLTLTVTLINPCHKPQPARCPEHARGTRSICAATVCVFRPVPHACDILAIICLLRDLRARRVRGWVGLYPHSRRWGLQRRTGLLRVRVRVRDTMSESSSVVQYCSELGGPA